MVNTPVPTRRPVGNDTGVSHPRSGGPRLAGLRRPSGPKDVHDAAPTSNFDGFHDVEQTGDVPLYYIRSMTRSHGFIARSAVTKSVHLIDTWKLLVPAVGLDGSGNEVALTLFLGRR